MSLFRSGCVHCTLWWISAVAVRIGLSLTWRFDRAKKTPSTRTFHSDAYLTKLWSPSTLVSEVVFLLKTHSGLDSWTDLPILESLVLSRRSAVFSLRLSAVRQTQDGGRTRLRRRRCMKKFLDAPARGQHFPSRGDGGREDFCHYGFGAVYLCIGRRTRSQLSHYGVRAVAEPRATSAFRPREHSMLRHPRPGDALLPGQVGSSIFLAAQGSSRAEGARWARFGSSLSPRFFLGCINFIRRYLFRVGTLDVAEGVFH